MSPVQNQPCAGFGVKPGQHRSPMAAPAPRPLRPGHPARPAASSPGTQVSQTLGCPGNGVRLEGGNKSVFSSILCGVCQTELQARPSCRFVEICVKKVLENQMFLVAVFGESSNCSFVENAGYLKRAEAIVLLEDRMQLRGVLQQLWGLQLPLVGLPGEFWGLRAQLHSAGLGAPPGPRRLARSCSLARLGVANVPSFPCALVGAKSCATSPVGLGGTSPGAAPSAPSPRCGCSADFLCCPRVEVTVVR